MNISGTIQRNERTSCTGCTACVQICPRHCISTQADSEGFLYPVVDEDTCIDCGLCENVCPVLHPYVACMPQDVYAAFNTDEETRMQSSSGGLFFLLAEKTIADGGVVFGARFDDEWQVVMDWADTLQGVKSFMGSKYVQARVETAYKEAERFLKQGRNVLFSGAPCQIAGLHHYLRTKYDNLTTVDFACHGVPSPKVWRRYLHEVAAAKKISEVKFRDKSQSWKQYRFVLSYGDGETATTQTSFYATDPYMRAFLSDLILRPSCHECRAKQGRSHSDITIADFWGVDREMPDMDDDKGTSLVWTGTEKGRQALDWSRVLAREVQLERASWYNAGLSQPGGVPPHHRRSLFFERLDAGTSLRDWIAFCLRPSRERRKRSTGERYRLRTKLLWYRLLRRINRKQR